MGAPVERTATTPIVVIAGSAGGVTALNTVLSALPATFPAPILVVQHRPAQRPSQLRAVLARRSKLPVRDAVDGDLLAPGAVYLARPDLHLTVVPPGRLQHVDGKRIRHVLSSANPLFDSAAGCFGRGVIAVVLSGSGCDATDGVQAVKQHGGVIIAQDEETSEHFSMPRSAIRTGIVDYVARVDDIAPLLERLVAGTPVPTATPL